MRRRLAKWRRTWKNRFQKLRIVTFRLARRFSNKLEALGGFLTKILEFYRGNYIRYTCWFFVLLLAFQASDIIRWYREINSSKEKVRTFEYEYQECLLKKGEYRDIIRNLALKYKLNDTHLD